MALIKGTNDYSGLIEAYESSTIKNIVEVSGKALVIYKQPMLGKAVLSEALIDIWEEQSVDGYNLGMLLLTVGGVQQIVFAADIKDITQEYDSANVVIGSKVTMRSLDNKLICSELIADIYAYQTSAVNLELTMVTRVIDNEPIIIPNKSIRFIYENDGSYVLEFNDTRDRMIIVEAPNALFLAQPQ